MACNGKRLIQRSMSENSQNEIQEALISKQTERLKSKDQSSCTCLNSCELHQKSAKDQTDEQDNKSNISNSNSKSSKNSQKQETSVDMRVIGSEDSVNSLGGKQNSRCRTVGKWCCQILTSVACTLIIVLCILKFVNWNSLLQLVPNDNDPSTARQTDKDHNATIEGVFGQLYLNMDVLKEQGRLAWVTDDTKSKSRGVLLNGNCFTVTEAGIFSITVSLTFQYGLDTSDTGTTFYTVVKQRTNILNKNTISLLPKKSRSQITYEKSPAPPIVVELQPKESVCVWVQNTNLLFQSKVDNVLSIFKIGNSL